jgi:hypothetical protein
MILTKIRRVFKLAFQSLIISLSYMTALALYISHAVVGALLWLFEAGNPSASLPRAGFLVGIPNRFSRHVWVIQVHFLGIVGCLSQIRLRELGSKWSLTPLACTSPPIALLLSKSSRARRLLNRNIPDTNALLITSMHTLWL